MAKISKNIIKSPITSIIGLVIIAASVFSVFKVEDVSWFDASIGIAIGACLMLAPDKLVGSVPRFRGSDEPQSSDKDELPPLP